MQEEKITYQEYITRIKSKHPYKIKEQIKYAEQIMPGNIYTKYIISLLKEATIESSEDNIDTIEPITFTPMQIESLLRAINYMVDNLSSTETDSNYNYIKTNLRPFFNALYNELQEKL